MLRLFRYKSGESILKRLIAELPDAPPGQNGKEFGRVRIGDITALTDVGKKIENCHEARALKPKWNTVQRGKELLVIVEPA